MKTAVVVYDSVYGNTTAIAEAIAKSQGCKAISVRDVGNKDLDEVGKLVVGSPTRGGRPTELMNQWINAIPNTKASQLEVAAFDTRMKKSELNWALKLLLTVIDYAAPKMAANLVAKGAKLIKPPEGFYVVGTEGGLMDGELDRAKNWL